MNNKQIAAIQKILHEWYELQKRALPWRETRDPYKIWISEIILQQTRVNQGLDYYNRFIERFPDVKSLAEATENEVLRYWQGLGYYSRARNLHKAALKITTDREGKFPDSYNEVLSLPGIGEYTAAAICSFAFGQPYATVDGNIYRVLARLTATDTPTDTSKGKKIFAEMAQNLLDKKNPGIHNQAIMEFGAMYCTPSSPDCGNCPLMHYCEASKLKIVSMLPVKQGKTKTTNRYFNYFHIKNGEFTYLQKRTQKDIWQNLYEFPLIETSRAMDLPELAQTDAFSQLFGKCKITVEKTYNPVKHILSHRIIYAVFHTIIIDTENMISGQVEKIPQSELSGFPVSRLTEMFLERE